MGTVAEGLSRVLADAPVRQGYLEAQAGVSSLSGWYARAEGRYRPLANLGFFGFSEATARRRMAGMGARWMLGL